MISPEELQLAARNHGMPLEALRFDLTPVGLHYLLVHYDIPVVAPDSWSLSVDGLVERPLTLSLDELRALPSATVVSTMECAGNGRARLQPHVVSQPWLLEAVGNAAWTGVPLREVLSRAGVSSSAVEVVFRALDRGIEGGVEQDYARALSVDDAMGDDVLLAYEVNGQPLPPQHGFPLRLLVPGWYGMTNVKWLAAVTVIDHHFDGYQHERGYRFRVSDDDPGEPVSRIAPRALMVPPGIPDFMSRRRTVRRAPCVLEGRAWSGGAPVESVEVSVDGGATWAPALLDPPVSRWAWRRWTHEWSPSAAGDVELCCRARAADGTEQPMEPVWNVGGYANNAVQRVAVTVTE